MKSIQTVTNVIHAFNPEAVVLPVQTSELIFDLSTRMSCFYCGRYNNNWRCPPRTPDVDYQALMREFDTAVMVYQSFEVTSTNRDSVRIESSQSVHRTLLVAEKHLFEHNCPNPLSFIGGSCKLCKSGCGPERCNNPYQSRMPVEATGINVVRTMERLGVDIRFPVHSQLLRVGLLVWNRD